MEYGLGVGVLWSVVPVRSKSLYGDKVDTQCKHLKYIYMYMYICTYMCIYVYINVYI